MLKRHIAVLAALGVTAVGFLLYYTNNMIFLSAGTTANSIHDKTIILDAGHGGEDGGAVAADGTSEKEINLKIVQKIKQIANLNGYNVVLTRSGDEAIYDKDSADTLRKRKVSDMHNRLKIMNSTPNSIFVSIHLNKFESGSVHGAQVFYSKNLEDSKLLAQNIQSAINDNIKTDKVREVKPNTDKIFLLKNAQIPAVIVECGFLSNENDLKNLKNEEFQYRIAMCIFFGIDKTT